MNKKIKPGDTVVIREGSSAYKPYKFENVASVSKTQLVTSDGKKWMLGSGRLFGSGMSCFEDRIQFDMTVKQAEEYNAEWLTENEIKQIRSAVYNTRLSDLSNSKIIRIKAIIDETEN